MLNLSCKYLYKIIAIRIKRQLVIKFNLLLLDAIVRVIRDIPVHNCKLKNKDAYQQKVAQEHPYHIYLYNQSLNNSEEQNYVLRNIRAQIKDNKQRIILFYQPKTAQEIIKFVGIKLPFFVYTKMKQVVQQEILFFQIQLYKTQILIQLIILATHTFFMQKIIRHNIQQIYNWQMVKEFVQIEIK